MILQWIHMSSHLFLTVGRHLFFPFERPPKTTTITTKDHSRCLHFLLRAEGASDKAPPYKYVLKIYSRVQVILPLRLPTGFFRPRFPQAFPPFSNAAVNAILIFRFFLFACTDTKTTVDFSLWPGGGFPRGAARGAVAFPFSVPPSRRAQSPARHHAAAWRRFPFPPNLWKHLAIAQIVFFPGRIEQQRSV